MLVIVVTARGADRRLSGLLRRFCGDGASLLCVETRSAAFSGGGRGLVFVSGPSFERIACENAAFIVRGDGCLPAQIDCANAVAVVDSSNAAVMGQVAARRLRALTCGLATSDTFTLSSLTSDSAVISLQRPVAAFDGLVVEPFELPVRFSTRAEPFSLLACASIFCLMGAENPLAHAADWTIPPV